MRYLALACDYDGTLAHNGQVDETTLAALERLRDSGRRLILVTGRQIDDLLHVFPYADLFDRIVAENGALLYQNATQEEKLLGDRPSAEFIKALRERGVDPFSVGKVIVATWHPHETTVLEVIRELGLELQIIFNKGAVMVLPSGLNKATGLGAALSELGLSPHNTVGVGDAENDHAFLDLCECSVGVANALPVLKERVDFVTNGSRGAGVTELIDKLVASDLAELEPQLTRHQILLGTCQDSELVNLKPYGVNLLVAGTSGSGKSTLATGILERLSERGYQFCIIDPEGDYEAFEGAVILGDHQREPSVAEALELLENPSQNAVINLIGVSLENRPSFFENLLPHLQQLRAKTGRPHWIVVDEAHHLLPSSWDPAVITLPQELEGIILITVHPDRVSAAALSLIDTLIAVGEDPEQTVKSFCKNLVQQPPSFDPPTLEPGEAVAWFRRTAAEPFQFRIALPRIAHRRHLRHYAKGEMGADKSFYFRGSEGKLKLRAQNLVLFNQLAEGVDDATWLYHLRRGDYSRWFREAIKDEDLAAEAAQVEQSPNNSPEQSRALIRDVIEQRYTAPS
ncbi:HAD-IIB family hydrolase [Nostoc sp.]|uniref:HAD-IIB family hydrolase n=1 Tax=Nostoc sp. TaxID=1180 RepID=UPI0035935774